MILTLKWLKEFLDTNASIEIIEETLTSIGLEVESVIDRRAELSCFLIGKILEASPHPNANKLQVCKVQISDTKVLQIVCGAQNARAGILVVLAPIGTQINSTSIVIKEAEIRGVKSYGMLCSRAELSLGKEILPEQLESGILEMPETAQIGDNLTKYFDLDDIIFTCNVTPNRGDCLSVYGIARDLSASGIGTLKTLTLPTTTLPEIVDNSENAASAKCAIFSLWQIENITQLQTPSWIRYRLENVGIKRVNPVVDILNYVSHSFGQPMHAYDATTLKGQLSVNYAKQGCDFLALDAKQYHLVDSDIVINAGKEIAAIAGIIGSQDTKIALTTSKIVIESAVFDATTISNTGKRLKIQTEARYRFERHVDPELCLTAAQIAVQMCVEICGGKLIASSVAKRNNTKQKFLVLNISNVENFLGLKIAENEIIAILEKLGFVINKTEQNYKVAVPSWRSDIDNENDLISEIIRIYGYNRIPAQNIPQVYTKNTPDKVAILNTLLVQSGYTEVITWSFVSNKASKEFSINNNAIELENPISEELAYLRQSIIPNLLETTKKTQARSINSASVFEIGPVFWDVNPDDEIETLALLKCGPIEEMNPYNKPQNADICDLKGDIEYLFKYLKIDLTKLSYSQQNLPKFCHPKKCSNIFLDGIKLGYMGELHPGLAKELKCKTLIAELYIDSLQMPKLALSNSYYCPSSYQAVKRDLAFLIDQKRELGPILTAVLNLRTDLIKKVNLFDIFQDHSIPKEKKSFAITYWIQAEDRTLTDSEITQVQQQIISLVYEEFKATLRV